MTNPLLQKYDELYGKKEEPVVEEKYEMPPEWDVRGVTTTNAPNYISTKSSSTSFKTYDIDSGKDSFLRIAELVKQNKAKITSMNMDIDPQTRTQRITCEVWDTF